MAVGGGFAEDGGTQPQCLDDPGGAQVIAALDPMEDIRLGDGIGAVGFHIDGNGAGHTDGVAQLDFAAVGSACLHDGLGDVAGHICRGAVYLGGILTAECAAAVTGVAAVGIHNDLAAGESGIGSGAAQYKPPGGVDEILGFGIQHFGGDAGLDDLFDHIPPQGDGIGVLIVLGGKHHRIDPDGLAVFVFHCHLCFAVGTEIAELSAFADRRQPPGDAVCQRDGQGH